MSLFYGEFEGGIIVAQYFDTFVVFLVFLFAQCCNVGDFGQLAEHRILGHEGHSFKYIHILQYIYPTFKVVITLVLLFRK